MKYRRCFPGDVFCIPLKPRGYGNVIAARVSKPSGRRGYQSIIWYALGAISARPSVRVGTATIADVVAVSHLDGNAHIEENGWTYVGRVPNFSTDTWPVFPVIERTGVGLWMDTDDLEMQEFDASIIDEGHRDFFRQLAGDCSSGYLNEIVLSEVKRPFSTRHGIRFTPEHIHAHKKYAPQIRADIEKRRKRGRKRQTDAVEAKKLKTPKEFWELMGVGVDGAADERMRDNRKVSKRQFLIAVRKSLAASSRAEAKAFGMSMGAALVEARTWKLWSAAYIMNGGCSEDGFLYFRLWLLAQGRGVYSAAMKDPESLASATLRFGKPGDFEFEELLNVVDDVIGEFDYSVHELCDGIDASPKESTPDFTPDTLSQLYPNLWAKFA